MIPVGEVFALKEGIKEEITPNFHAAVMKSLGEPYPTSFGDPKYVFDITYFTDSLKLFLENVLKSLKRFGTTPFPLIRGFGFGKTHSLIVLWHLFTSGKLPSNEHVKRLISENKQVIKQTFVLACDVSERDPPLGAFLKTLFESERMEKDYDLLNVLIELREKYEKEDLLNPAKFSEMLKEFVSESKRRYDKVPKFLILIDELGFGTVKRIEEYINSKFTEVDLIDDIRKLISFIYSIAEELKNRGSSLAIVFALADQDLRSIEARINYVSQDKNAKKKLEALKDMIEIDLIERLKRQSGGLERSPLQFNPIQNIEIAKFRVLRSIGDEKKSRDEVVFYIRELLKTFNIFEAETDIQNYVKSVEKFYPLSPELLNLLMKAHDTTEFPRTEYVRTVISLLNDAVDSALKNEPYAPLIGINNLTLQQSALFDILDEYAQTDWLSILKDLDIALSSISNEKLAGHIARLIIAKGSTSNILSLIEEKNARKYGTSDGEIQASIISSFPQPEVSRSLEQYQDILLELKIKSARISERTINGKRLYLPSIVRHVIAQRGSYFLDERKKVEDVGPLTYIRDSSVFPLINKLSRAINLKIILSKEIKELSTVRLDEPTCYMIPPWDLTLYNDIQKYGYDRVIQNFSSVLNEKFREGEILRAPYYIVLVPDLSRLDKLVNSLIEYSASIKFLDYLKKEESITRNYIRRFEVEILTKRAGKGVDKEKISKYVIQGVQQQIKDARNAAMADVVIWAREVVSNLLKLYRKPIIYSPFNKEFIPSIGLLERVEETVNQIVSEIKTKDIEKYSDMIAKFIEAVQNLVGFEEKPEKVSEALLNKIKAELTRNPLEELSAEDLVENLILGNYGIFPKSYEIANKAISMLDGKILDLPDSIVEIKYDRKSKKLLFTYKAKEPRFKISHYEVFPKRAVYGLGEKVRLRIRISNEGAKGKGLLRVERVDEGVIVFQENIKEMGAMDEKMLEIDFTLPNSEGSYRYNVIVLHNHIEIDDQKILEFEVKRGLPPQPPPVFIRKIYWEATDENKDKIVEFVSTHQIAFSKCEISVYADDFDVTINAKNLNKENLDVLLRFILPLARRCNTHPKVILVAKHGHLRKEDIDIEDEHLNIEYS